MKYVIKSQQTVNPFIRTRKGKLERVREFTRHGIDSTFKDIDSTFKELMKESEKKAKKIIKLIKETENLGASPWKTTNRLSEATRAEAKAKANKLGEPFIVGEKVKIWRGEHSGKVGEVVGTDGFDVKVKSGEEVVSVPNIQVVNTMDLKMVNEEKWGKDEGKKMKKSQEQVKPFTRTRKGKFERVKGFSRIRDLAKYPKATDEAAVHQFAKDYVVSKKKAREHLEEQKQHLKWERIHSGKFGEPYSFSGADLAGKKGKMPKELQGLWNAQYKPRETAILNSLPEDGKAKWEAKTIFEKIGIIDRLQVKGFFSKLGEPFKPSFIEGQKADAWERAKVSVFPMSRRAEGYKAGKADKILGIRLNIAATSPDKEYAEGYMRGNINLAKEPIGEPISVREQKSIIRRVMGGDLPRVDEDRLEDEPISMEKKYSDRDFKVELEIEHLDFADEENEGVRSVAVVDYTIDPGSKGGKDESPYNPGVDDKIVVWAEGPKKGEELTSDEEKKYLRENKYRKQSYDSILDDHIMQYAEDQNEAMMSDHYESIMERRKLGEPISTYGMASLEEDEDETEAVSPEGGTSEIKRLSGNEIMEVVEAKENINKLVDMSNTIIDDNAVSRMKDELSKLEIHNDWELQEYKELVEFSEGELRDAKEKGYRSANEYWQAEMPGTVTATSSRKIRKGMKLMTIDEILSLKKSKSQYDFGKEVPIGVMEKAIQVKPFTRTRRGRMESVKGFSREAPNYSDWENAVNHAIHNLGKTQEEAKKWANMKMEFDQAIKLERRKASLTERLYGKKDAGEMKEMHLGDAKDLTKVRNLWAKEDYEGAYNKAWDMDTAARDNIPMSVWNDISKYAKENLGEPFVAEHKKISDKWETDLADKLGVVKDKMQNKQPVSKKELDDLIQETDNWRSFKVGEPVSTKETDAVVKREDSKYGNMKWVVIIPLPNGGKSRTWYKTEKEAKYEAEKYRKSDKDKYTGKLGEPVSVPGEGYIEAKKNPAGHYQLFYRGTRNEVFPGEKFKSSAEARNRFKVPTHLQKPPISNMADYKKLMTKPGEPISTEETVANRMRKRQVANTILTQMGGAGKLKLMTGAKNFIALDSGVSFEFPNSKGPNYMKVTLEPDDTYTVEFGRKKRITPGTMATMDPDKPISIDDFYKKLSEQEDVYWEDLKGIFERETGLYLSFGKSVTSGEKYVVGLEKSKGGFRMAGGGAMGEEEKTSKKKEQDETGEKTQAQERMSGYAKRRREEQAPAKNADTDEGGDSEEMAI